MDMKSWTDMSMNIIRFGYFVRLTPSITLLSRSALTVFLHINRFLLGQYCTVHVDYWFSCAPEIRICITVNCAIHSLHYFIDGNGDCGFRKGWQFDYVRKMPTSELLKGRKYPLKDGWALWSRYESFWHKISWN